MSTKQTVGNGGSKKDETCHIILEQAADAIFQGDPQGNFLEVNPACLQLTGFSREELLSMNMRDLFAPDTLQAKPLRYDLLQQGQHIITERSIKTKSGKLILVEMNSTMLSDGNYVSIMRDLSRREKAREVLDENLRMYSSYYNMFRLMADNTRDLLWAKDLDNNYIFTNQAMCDILLQAKDTQEPIGRNDQFFARRERESHPDDLEWHTFGEICADTDLIVQKEKKPMQFDEYGNVRGKFLFLDVHKAPIWDAQGVMIGVVGTARDVTEYKLTEKALKESEEKYRMLVETTGDIIIMHDNQGIITFINQAGLNFLGYEYNEIIGKSVVDFIPRDKQQEMFQRKQKREAGDNSLFNYQTEFISKSDRKIILDVQSRSISEDKQFQGAIVVARDITESSKNQNELIRMQKLESVGTLAGGIAHDFNNILTALFGNISMARAELSPDQKCFSYLENALKALTRATHLTQQLLTFSRGGEPVREEVDLDLLTHETAVFDLSGSNVRLDYAVDPDLAHVWADKGQIQQAVSNLILNAREAMPTGGVLLVRLHNITYEMGDHPALNPGKYVRISIRDEGMGIDPDFLNRIFDPYFSTKQRGSGLGLATCYSIVNRHKGYIEVDSQPGKGSEFRLFLPAGEIKKPAKGEKKETHTPRHDHQASILVMDDEPMIREILVDMLETLGAKVETSAEGREAISKYRLSHEKGEGYDLVILDLTIPGGVGGREAAVEILQINPDARLVVSSGYASDPIMSHYREYGFCGVIAKPFTLDQLQKNIFNILKNS